MLNVVKILSATIDSNKRRIIKFLRLGKKDVQTSFEAMPFGTDSHPVENLKAIYGKTSDSGKTVIIGYINTEQIAKVGEHRMYSTDADGNVVMYLHMKNDGTAEFNGNGDFMMRYNKMKIAFDQMRTELNVFMTQYNTHVHPYVGLPVTVPGITTPTAPPAVLSTADMTAAKIAEIKTSA